LRDFVERLNALPERKLNTDKGCVARLRELQFIAWKPFPWLPRSPPPAPL